MQTPVNNQFDGPLRKLGRKDFIEKAGGLIEAATGNKSYSLKLLKMTIAATVRLKDRYFWMELLMLCSITYFIAIFSDVEYSYYEEGSALKFINAIEYRLYFGTFHFVLYGCYYWYVLQPLVNRRKPWLIFLSVVVFVPVIHLYNHYVATWSASKIPFLSNDLRALAADQFKSHRPYAFVYAYMLSIRCLPLIFFAYLIRSLRQEAQLKALKEQQLTTELKYLKAQVQPHFFFNTLNNIYALAVKQSPDTAPMVLQLSEMMRYILYTAVEEKVPLQQEIEFIQHYVEIERIRYQYYIVIEFDVDGDIERADIEPLLLLPFIENAFKHGINDSTGEGFVQIVICVRNEELDLQVRNSKPQQTASCSTGGIGLTNVRKRLELLYPVNHRLTITEAEDEFQANLNIHLKKRKQVKTKLKQPADISA